MQSYFRSFSSDDDHTFFLDEKSRQKNQEHTKRDPYDLLLMLSLRSSLLALKSPRRSLTRRLLLIFWLHVDSQFVCSSSPTIICVRYVLFFISPCKDPSPYLYCIYDQKICHPTSDRNSTASEYRPSWQCPLEDFFHDFVIVGGMFHRLYASRQTITTPMDWSMSGDSGFDRLWLFPPAISQ